MKRFLIFAVLLVSSNSFAISQGSMVSTTKDTWLKVGTNNLQLISRSSVLAVEQVNCGPFGCQWIGTSVNAIAPASGVLHGWVWLDDVRVIAGQCAPNFSYECREHSRPESCSDACDRVCTTTSEFVCDSSGTNCSYQDVESCHNECHMVCYPSVVTTLCACEPGN